ncbi:MAG: GAF domain-containing protein [Armatimonadetes bacterium]|nr:GAF domain-containing protein [Armatimonadota bacterium]
MTVSPGGRAEGTVSALESEPIPRFTDPLEVLPFVNRLLTQVEDPTSLLTILLDSSISMTGAERGFILLDQHGKMQMTVGRNVRREDLQEQEFQVTWTLIGQVQQTGEGRILVDASRTPGLEASASVRRFSLQSVLCVPIQAGGRCLGVIYLDNRSRKGAFMLPDLELIKTLADQTAVTLVQARLRAESERYRKRSLDLENLSVILSHDLQEPLRAVESYASLMDERCGAMLDERGRKYLRRILAGGARMRHLLQDLLDLARLEAGNEFQAVSLEKAFAEAVLHMESAIRKTGASIECSGLPEVRGDATQLRHLFCNLLGNALKFRGETPPLIRTEVRQQEGLWHITVEDNGIGFDPVWAEEIFQPFRRLHTREEYAGTGIGLALCQRIVARHGGTIQAEAAPGRGARFTFTLPART